jgi:hypothetical protein
MPEPSGGATPSLPVPSQSLPPQRLQGVNPFATAFERLIGMALLRREEQPARW